MKLACWALVTLFLWPWGGVEPSNRTLGERLLGPATSLLASVEWVRFDALVHEGRYEAAYAVAERALELDPHSPQGWLHYASHLGRFRASAENEVDSAARRRWVRAALDLLKAGEERCERPGELALSSGLILLLVARLEEETGGLGWPGGTAAARAEAEECLARAVLAGVDVLSAAEAASSHSH